MTDHETGRTGPGADRSGADRPGSDHPGADRPGPHAPGTAAPSAAAGPGTAAAGGAGRGDGGPGYEDGGSAGQSAAAVPGPADKGRPAADTAPASGTAPAPGTAPASGTATASGTAAVPGPADAFGTSSDDGAATAVGSPGVPPADGARGAVPGGPGAGPGGKRGAGRGTARAVARIKDAFADAGVTGLLHARDIDTGAELGLGADTLMSTASVHKLCLVSTVFREAAHGRLDLTRQVEVTPQRRTKGPTGLAAFLDPARLSLRDLAAQSIAVSDNTAADVLWDEVGLETVNRTMAGLGLRRTRAVHMMRDLYASMAEDAGRGGAAALVEPAVVARLRVLDPTHTNRSTARELTRLLAAVWRDEVCGGEFGQVLRRVLGLQAWSHRLASGFPFDDVRVSGKTGTLPTLRHEAGVVEYPDGGRYAVAVLTRSASTVITLPAADAVIGTAARIAVDALRAPVR